MVLKPEDETPQSDHIPRELKLPGEDAVMLERESAVAEPTPKLSLLEFLATLEPLDEEFPEIEDLPLRPVDL